MNIYATDCLNPYHNLALEETLRECLFLWQNQRTVVIGAGQNAWLECDVDKLIADGGLLSRRKTGGGAVYHDSGNLNFSFCMPPQIYDVNRQLGVIISAMQSLGVHAEMSGRNDITVSGRKVSGNAFRLSEGSALHHGTLLINADFAAMARYLTPSRKKLEHRGVASLPARVCNLSECAEVSADLIKSALAIAFSREYGCASDILTAPEPPADLADQYASWDFIYGRTPKWDVLIEHKSPEMYLALGLIVKNGIIIDAQINTDALNETLAPRLSAALVLRRYDQGEISRIIADYC